MTLIVATDTWQSPLPRVVAGGGTGGTLLIRTGDLTAPGTRTPVGGTDGTVQEPGGETFWRGRPHRPAHWRDFPNPGLSNFRPMASHPGDTYGRTPAGRRPPLFARSC